jgi:UDP-3-O-[3-hydroxymyristoyl] glucosamine N-acyltransferase
MSWDGAVRLRPTRLDDLVRAHGGALHAPRSDSRESRETAGRVLGRFSPVETAKEGELAPLLAGRFIAKAEEAAARGAMLLIEGSLAADTRVARLGGWVHPHAAWAMACVLEDCATVPAHSPECGRDTTLGPHVVLGERVILGDRVTIGPGSVVGGVGFGWATGPGGIVKRVPHLGGVVIEDDVTVGPSCTIDAGVLGPTVIRRGAHLDAHVHVAHNCDIGDGTFVAAQAGFAGSVKVGRGVLIGGQAGIADHVTIGDGARIAAKSGVIGDVPPGATVAGYPAVARLRWLRGLAQLYRSLG